ncbi:MAG: tripartite tricarboxylate transporter substrate binding protein [Alphaproteobacteria bacterium]|nr:tripartite tricarboxylate transporter substrate binding protein [Alphaproteobacteria bacterium]
MSLPHSAKLILLALSLWTGAAHAAWPDRPIRLVVPYAAGAAGDILVRFMQQALLESLGQPIVIDNKPGAGGNLGTQEVVRAKPDGNTFLLGATNNFVINQFVYRNMGFNPLESLVPVAKLVNVPSVLFVNTASPSGSYAEFARHAQANPGRLNYGSPGPGTTPHLSAWALSEAMGARMTHVPYRGAAPGVQALVANEVQFFLVGYGVAAGHLGSGSIKALAVASGARLPVAPDVPTAKEAGLPDVILSNWWGVAAPKGTDPAVVGRMAEAFRRVLDLPATQAFLTRQGFVGVGSGPEQFARELPGEAREWQAIVGKAGTRLDD